MPHGSRVRRSGVSHCVASLCGAMISCCAIASLRADDPAPQAAAAWHEQASFAFGHRATATAFSPDGKTLALAGGADDETGIVKLFDVATGRERLSLDGHAAWVNAVAFSPDGKTLASGAGAESAGEIKFWDVATGKPLMTLAPDGGYVLSLGFSPDGKTLAVGSGYAENLRLFGRASFWDVASGRESPLVLQGAKGEHISLRAVAFILHHELAHIRLRHIGESELDRERDADYAAADWIVGDIGGEQSEEFATRTIGISIALLVRVGHEIHTGVRGGDSHPRSYDRLMHVLDRHIQDHNHHVWYFVANTLKLHLDNGSHLAQIPKGPFDSGRACVDAYIDALSRVSQ